MLFAAMAIHAFFSIALLSTSTLIDRGFYSSQNIPWLGSGLLDDQRAGGSWSWAMGEIPIILALIATFILWMRDDAKESRRIDRNEERKAALGEPDELAQYNAYLKSLSTREEK
jgi:cytochrome c oxidase assembly factor CtaG